MARPRRRTTTLRMLRALWRYRGSLAAHGDRYQEEVATAVCTALNQHLGGRIAYAGYRVAMRTMLIATVLIVIVAALLALVLALTIGGWWTLLAVPVLIVAAWLGFLRARWGAPLDWLSEHADPTRQVPLDELPARLRTIAGELRELADVPANVSRELDALAGDVEAAQGPHVA